MNKEPSTSQFLEPEEDTLRNERLPTEYDIRIQQIKDSLMTAGVNEKAAGQLAFEQLSETESLIKTERDDVQDILNKDVLTGVYNRRYFDEMIAKEMERSERYETTFSILSLDIDKFKAVNDTLGHPGGDFALKKMSEIMQKEFRNSDMVCRVGGEEFTIILPETNNEQAVIAGEKLRSQIELKLKASLVEQYGESASDLMGTISVGIASYKNGEGKDTLLKRADDALYTAKETGRNRIINGEGESVKSETTRNTKPSKIEAIEDLLPKNLEERRRILKELLTTTF